MDGDEPTTQDLRLDQLRREAEERAQAAGSASEAETRAHDRRADKAAYLRDKLAERERSERAARGGDAPDPAPGA